MTTPRLRRRETDEESPSHTHNTRTKRGSPGSDAWDEAVPSRALKIEAPTESPKKKPSPYKATYNHEGINKLSHNLTIVEFVKLRRGPNFKAEEWVTKPEVSGSPSVKPGRQEGKREAALDESYLATKKTTAE